MQNRAAVYCRISGVDDDREASLETQVDSCRAHLKKLGYSVDEDDIFIDQISGTLRSRPALDKVRAAILQKKYDVLCVHALDRLSRKYAFLVVVFDEAERNDCEILSATEEFDKSPEGELLRNIRGYVAEVERLKVLERTARGVDRIIRQGQPVCSGLARFGYKYEYDVMDRVKSNRKRVVVPEEAEIVRKIFGWAADGQSVRQIRLKLHEEQVPSPGTWRKKKWKDGRTTHWSPDTLRKILRDRSYLGEPMVWGKTQVTGEKNERGRSKFRQTTEAERKQLVEATPRIVDDETFQKAQDTILRHKTYGQPSGKTWRLLSGMIKCGYCGKSLTAQKTWKWGRKGHYYFYLCSAKRDGADKCVNGRMQIGQVEEAAWDQVERILSDREALKAVLAGNSADSAELLEADLAAHEKKLADAEQKIRRLVDRLAEEDDPTFRKIFQEKRAALKQEIEQHREAAAEVQNKIANFQQVEFFRRDLQAILDDPSKQLGLSEPVDGDRTWRHVLQEEIARCSGGGWTPEKKRAVLEALNARVFVKSQTVIVQLDLPLAQAAGCAAATRQVRYRIVLPAPG